MGLILSNDGIHFREPVPDFRFLPRGESGSWESGSIWGVSFQNVGNTTRIYYCGMTGGGSTVQQPSHIGLATLDRDRFGYLSLKDTGESGTFLTSPIELPARARIFVNADGVSAESTIRLALLDERYQPLPGYSLEDCRSITDPGLRQPLVWKGIDVITHPDARRVVLQGRLESKGAASPHLYAVYLTDADPGNR